MCEVNDELYIGTASGQIQVWDRFVINNLWNIFF